MNITFALVRPFSLRHRLYRIRTCRSVVPMALAVLLSIGCGTAADGEIPGGEIPSGYPTIASPDFQGTFEITGATVGRRSLDLGTASTRQIAFDVVTGAATLDVGCSRRLGSFTLSADGQASITLTGRTEIDPCSPSEIDESILELVDRVERWEQTEGGFRLLAAGGDRVVLSGP